MLATGWCSLQDGCGVERASSGGGDLLSNDSVEVFARPLCGPHDREVGNKVILAPGRNVLELLAGSVSDVLEFQRLGYAAGNLSLASTVALSMRPAG